MRMPSSRECAMLPATMCLAHSLPPLTPRLPPSTVSTYMLAQRVKAELFPDVHEYHTALETHHKVMVAAMKSKQTADVEAADKLDAALKALSHYYVK